MPVPQKYEFDDTPKAFKRMLQRKNGDEAEYKKRKNEQAEDAGKGQKGEPKKDKVAYTNTKTSNPTISDTSNSSYSKSSPHAINTIRAKRKAHLQARDLKKKLKRGTAALEDSARNQTVRRDVREVVQEPPRLHQPKKTFKKVKESTEEIKSWSEDDELAEDDEE